MAFELTKDWFYTPAFDFEQKKYQFLSWQQHAQKRLQNRLLYPLKHITGQLLEELSTLRSIRGQSKSLLRGKVKGISLADYKLLYEEQEDLSELSNLDRVMKFCESPLLDIEARCSFMKQDLTDTLNLETIGLSSVDHNKGFVLVNHSEKVLVYKYTHCVVFSGPHVHMDYYSSSTVDPKALKAQLSQTYGLVQTWVVHGGEQWPIKNALIPVVSELLYQRLV